MTHENDHAYSVIHYFHYVTNMTKLFSLIIRYMPLYFNMIKSNRSKYKNKNIAFVKFKY